MNKKRIKKFKNYYLNKLGFKTICVNCGGLGPHFIGPSLGGKGFYTCNKKNND